MAGKSSDAPPSSSTEPEPELELDPTPLDEIEELLVQSAAEAPLSEKGWIGSRILRIVDRQLRWRRQTTVHRLFQRQEDQAKLRDMLAAVLPAVIAGYTAGRGKPLSSDDLFRHRDDTKPPYEVLHSLLMEGHSLVEAMLAFYGELLSRNLLKQAPPDMADQATALRSRIEEWAEVMSRVGGKKEGPPPN